MQELTRSLVLFFAVPSLASAAAAQDPGLAFAEQYALAPERGKAVAALLAGSEDAFYYGCREKLATRDFAGARALLAQWLERYGPSGRVTEIRNRLALLSYPEDPRATFDYLREHL